MYHLLKKCINEFKITIFPRSTTLTFVNLLMKVSALSLKPCVIIYFLFLQFFFSRENFICSMHFYVICFFVSRPLVFCSEHLRPQRCVNQIKFLKNFKSIHPFNVHVHGQNKYAWVEFLSSLPFNCKEVTKKVVQINTHHHLSIILLLQTFAKNLTLFIKFSRA